MKHVSHIQGLEGLPDGFITRVTGRYYTHEAVARHMLDALVASMGPMSRGRGPLRIIDPFAGDGRLVRWLLESWDAAGLPETDWEVTLWDLDDEGLRKARRSILSKARALGVTVKTHCKCGDAFKLALKHSGKFDVVVTNPPWELLKPDRRELRRLGAAVQEEYVAAMREYDGGLTSDYPDSQPKRKFAGWGTNLSRVGLDACRSVCTPEGRIAAVMPASFLADDQSRDLRAALFREYTLLDAAYFPAEAKLFGRADVATATLVVTGAKGPHQTPSVTTYDAALSVESRGRLPRNKSRDLGLSGRPIPISLGVPAIALLDHMAKHFPTWEALESKDELGLWAGREVDETGSARWLLPDGDGPLFIKGRMIDRYVIRTQPSLRACKPGWEPPTSTGYERIAWRDVSRPNQKRRLIATLVEPGVAAGNSIGVAHFRDGDPTALRALLGVINSVCFEVQLRAHLATGHVSLSSLRKVPTPPRAVLEKLDHLVSAVDRALAGEASAEAQVEGIVARDVYGLSRSRLELVLGLFPKIRRTERDAVLQAYDEAGGAKPASTRRRPKSAKASEAGRAATIPNHFSARLSALDMQIVHAVPPGGNWKDVPVSVPSKRLSQIRESFKQGKGSRSTYYGRLLPDAPAYTINTYFSRPGNGCHIHYAQDRVLSQREAARLQSFPDDFAFHGVQGDVNRQIGNAVPPLLAYQIAQELGEPGRFIDLFCGAGGLGLGFAWAGWTPIVANDIVERYLITYANNVHDRVVLGSIAESAVFNEIMSIAQAARAEDSQTPLWVLGGPPCQGFSTAGNRRSMDDERNHLVWQYKRFLEELRPDGFVFENVTGLLNMEKGMVFRRVQDAFRSVMPNITGWLLNAADYAVPQRRRRVILVGTAEEQAVEAPPRVTSLGDTHNLFETTSPPITVEEALDDLPPLEPGEDGSQRDYTTAPQTAFQAFVRGQLSAHEFLSQVRAGLASFPPTSHRIAASS